MKRENVIAFCILMENDKGILNKSADYVEEKFKALIEMDAPYPKTFLDAPNTLKFDEWFRIWMK